MLASSEGVDEGLDDTAGGGPFPGTALRKRAGRPRHDCTLVSYTLTGLSDSLSAQPQCLHGAPSLQANSG